ncbi:MAG: hypothetical protein ACMUIG_10290 [Thermoplasmatota archaeon]
MPISRSKLTEAVPHLTLFITGFLLSGIMHPALAGAYLLIFIGANIWFWKSICTNCYSFGNSGCPSGYGIISSRFFRKADKPDFRRAFRRNIWVIVLQFTLPLVFTVPFLLFPGLSPFADLAGRNLFYLASAAIAAAFSLTAFVWIPVHSRKKACHKCPQRRDCPWTNR